MFQDYRLWQRDYLLEISRAMTSQLDLRQVLKLILETATELVGGQGGLIALVQSDGSYQITASYGLPAQMLPMLNPLFTDIPDVGGTYDPLQWNVPNVQHRLNDIARKIGIVLRQVVGLPMIVKDVLVGIIYVFRREGAAFSVADRRILSAFAGQAAIAVHNAKLYYQVTQDKRRLDAIIENSGDGVMILDPSQRIVVFNRALSLMTGIPASEAIGHLCWEILVSQDPEDRAVCPLCPTPECQKGEMAYVEGDFIRQDATRITFGITYSPLLDSDNQLVNIIANVHDITHFREAEEIKSTFVSVISHELKTPVALIKGYANTLRREDANWDKETMRDSLTVIEEESDRLASLIDNLLDVSRLQSGQLKLDKTDVRVDKMVERTVNDFRTQTDKHTFELDFPPDFPVVQADYERFRQVLTNLISNAIKYSPQGGRIMLSGRFDDAFVYIAVTDEGIGIPPGERDLIFERFYRVENALSRKTQGAGLGLYLVKSVIDAHGGRIWVDSNLGQGSTFVFTLPRN
jgi:PAS domain S-box-containing protein